MATRSAIFAALACFALAAASLPLAGEPVYDAWAWLVWGRELAQLKLDATTGPTWKPLPVALAAALSLAGDAAPQLWLVLVRAAWLGSLVLAAELAHRLAAGRPPALRIAAAAFGACAVALLSDDVTPWARQAAGGMSEPLLVALVLGAVRAALGARTRTALVLGALAALVRPEAWPPLALYALWCWRADRRARPLVLALALGVPALWLVPELVGAGGGGAERARRGTSDPLEALGRAVALPLAVAWPLALLALRDRRARVLAAGALLWIALVAAMTLAGFPGLARFVSPAAAIVCVLGGAGLAVGVTWLRSRARPRASNALALLAVLAALVATSLALPERVSELPRTARAWARVEASHDRLRVLTRAVGRDALLRCGRLATSDTLVRTALAWQLGVPLSQVVSFGAPPRLSGAFVVGPGAGRALGEDVHRVARLVGRSGEWRVYSLRCPATARSSAVCSAGVSGATR